MPTDFQKFYRGFTADVIDFANSDEGYPQKEQAFTAIVAEDLSQAGIVESPTISYYLHGLANTVKKANGYSIPEEDTCLDLLITLYHGKVEPPSVNTRDISKAFNQLERFLKAAIDGFHKEVESGSEGFHMLHQVNSLIGDIDRVRFFLLTDGRVSLRSDKKKKEEIAGLAVTYEIWDIERIFRFRSSSSTHEPVELDLKHLPDGGLAYAGSSEGGLGYDTKCAIIPGRVLADLYDDHGQRLLELNVRSYLQARGKVNQGILETLYDQPERFLAYNNGITIVAEELQTGKLKDGTPGITAIKGLQIVNGGQTTASIHKSSKAEKSGKYKGLTADLERVSVQAKITVIDSTQFDELVPLISKFSNTQNKVTEVDLRANHPFHTGFERICNKTWAPGEKSIWFYERARGSFQTLKTREATTTKQKKDFENKYPTSQKFGPMDLAKHNNCWNQHPHIASKGGQKSFVYFMQGIGKKDDDWEPTEEELKNQIGSAILYKSVHKISRQIGYKGQQVHCCNYTVALLSQKTAKRINLKAIWDKQSISEALEAMILDWAPQIMERMAESAGTGNPTEWYKKPECWQVIRKMDLTISRQVNGELVKVAGSSVEPETDGGNTKKRKKKPQKLSAEDQNNIARCREVSSQRWLAIIEWGKKTGSLEKKQIGIAATMASLAVSDWPDDKPSRAQAWHGVQMLEAAEENL